MRQPATRRRPRAIPYPSVNPPTTATTPSTPATPPPPPPPSLLLRWDAEGSSGQPQEHSSERPYLLHRSSSRRPLPRSRGEDVEGYSTAVPSPSHFRAERSSLWAGTTSTTVSARIRHASTTPPPFSRTDLPPSSSSIPSSSGALGPHLSHYLHSSSSSTRNTHYWRPNPSASSDRNVSKRDDVVDCHRNPDVFDPSLQPETPSSRKTNGVREEDSSRLRNDGKSPVAHECVADRDSRRAKVPSKYRGGQHDLFAGFLFALMAASSLWRHCAALCPPRCQCDDLTLSATCSDAALEVIPIQLNPEVESISLHGNRISAVDQSLGFYARLRHLDLSSNRLRSLGERNFQLQGSLTSLNVSGNHIASVARHAFAGIGLSESLRVLDLARNRLGTFPLATIAGLRSLNELYLSYNQLTSVGDGDGGGKIHLHSLELLDLTGNKLQEVPTQFLSHIPVLRVLILARNELSGFPDGSLPSSGLKTISFAGNVNLGSSGIEDMAFSSTSKTLLSLDLSDAGLTTVPSKALSVLGSALTELDLSGNPIGELPEGSFSPLRSLKKVHLSRLSLLSTVHPAAFAGPALPTSSLSSSPQAVTTMCPPQLEHISMEWNPNLQRLPEGLFASCIRLTTLTLRGAALEGLDATVLPAPPVRLRSLSLAGNPLRCNCSLMWLSALANATVGSQPFLDGARCAEPPRLSGRLLSRLAQAELRCEPSWETVLAIAMASVTFLLLTGFAILFGRRCARHYKCCGSLETPTPTPTAPPPPPPRRHFPPLHSNQQNGVSHRKDMEFGVWGGKGPLGGGRNDSIAANEYTDLIGVGVGRMVIPPGYRGPTGVYV